MKLKILAILALLILPLAASAEVIEWPDGTVMEGPIVDGERHGQWTYTRPDGTSYTIQFINGVEQERTNTESSSSAASAWQAGKPDIGL